jgi:hypothetical protein
MIDYKYYKKNQLLGDAFLFNNRLTYVSYPLHLQCFFINGQCLLLE